MSHFATKPIAYALLLMSALPCVAQDKLPLAPTRDNPMVSAEALDFSLYSIGLPPEPEPTPKAAPVQSPSGYPAADLYKRWDSEGLFGYSGITLPEQFDIDLRGYCMPTTNTVITDVFGYRPRRRRVHYGLDIDVETGDTIRAAFDGKVRVRAFNRKGYGNYVVIRHENGLETLYGHLSKALVHPDEYVHAGDPIGLGGSTGRSTGSHLHFETRLLGTALNPALMFDFPNQTAKGNSYQFVRKAQAKKPASSGTKYYKVRQGDTLSKIAARNGTSIKNICKLNRITQNTVIRPGQTLRVR